MLGAVEHPMGATQTSVRFHDASEPSGRGGYLGRLKRDLGIVGGQSQAWESFASSLRANARRMGAARGVASKSADVCVLVFGSLPDRLAALAAMKPAATELLAVLTPAQRRQAARLLPLCCLPAAERG